MYLMFKSFIATPSNVLSFSLLKGSLSFLLEDDVEVDELSGSLLEFALVDMYLTCLLTGPKSLNLDTMLGSGYS